MLRLLASLPKAAVVAMGSLVLAGGAAGAAASVGGSEVPRPVEAVLSALGFSDGGRHRDDDDHRSATATGTARSDRGRKATATGTPSAPSVAGLCNAYERGSDNGREHKGDGFAFIRLKNAAAAAGQSVDDFCDDHEHAKKHATPRATGTATRGNSERGKSEDNRSQGRGRDGADDDKSGKSDKSESRGNSDGHRQGLGALGGATLAPQGDDHGKNRDKDGTPAPTPATTGAASSVAPATTNGGTSDSKGNNGSNGNSGDHSSGNSGARGSSGGGRGH